MNIKWSKCNAVNFDYADSVINLRFKFQSSGLEGEYNKNNMACPFMLFLNKLKIWPVDKINLV